MTDEWMRRIEERLWPGGVGRGVWMIVDAARDRRISGLLRSPFLEYSCLFSGALAPELKAVAPYLVQLVYHDQRTERFLRLAWGNSWGIFLKCDMEIDSLRRHLRGFLMVRDPAGRRLMFRYYDPRVLRVYLPTCTAAELRAIFGPVERIWMEDEQSERLLEFGFDRVQLVQRAIALDAEERSA